MARDGKRVYPWPELMRAKTAAAYLDISVSHFLKMVDEGLLPKASKRLRGAVLWDRADLVDAMESLKIDDAESKNTVDIALEKMRKKRD